MEETLEGLRDTVCIPYLDDILVYSGSFNYHMAHVRMVLKRLKGKGIKLKPRKCNLFKNQVCYLGRIVSEQGYQIDPAATSVIENVKQLNPKTVGELRRILGFAGYYRSFILDFARIAKPLYDLIQNPGTKAPKQRGNVKGKGQAPSNQEIKWTEEHQAVLEKLLNKLVSPPILGFPILNNLFYFHIDASQDGIASVIYQKQNGKLVVIAYGLTQPEKNYHLHSGKLAYLCLHWAVTQRFKDDLFYATSFTVISDYNPLQYVMTTVKLNSTGFRWIKELSNYNFIVKYRPGNVHTDVDVLSRLILDESKIYQKYSETISLAEFKMLYKSLKQNWISSITVDPVGNEKKLGDCLNFDNLQQFSQSEIALAQLDDFTIRPVVQWKQRRHRPSRYERKGGHHDTTRILIERNKLKLINGVSYRNCGLRKQIVVPKKFAVLYYAGINLTGYNSPPQADPQANKNPRKRDSFSVQNSCPWVEKTKQKSPPLGISCPAKRSMKKEHNSIKAVSFQIFRNCPFDNFLFS